MTFLCVKLSSFEIDALKHQTLFLMPKNETCCHKCFCNNLQIVNHLQVLR